MNLALLALLLHGTVTGDANPIGVNRSMPPATVIPELAYSEVSPAIDWLTAAFGFTLRLRIGDHRAQLHVPPDGAVVLTALADGTVDHSLAVTVRIEDADAHHAQAVSHGARA